MDRLREEEIIFVLFFIGILVTGFYLGVFTESSISAEEAANKSIKYIQGKIIAPRAEAYIEEVSESSGLYKIVVVTEENGFSNTVDTYITKDGKLFFPHGIHIDEGVTGEEPCERAENFAKNILYPRSSVYMSGYSEESSLYRISLLVKKNSDVMEEIHYVTKDGKIFFPRAMCID